jgi:hypothetical protein
MSLSTIQLAPSKYLSRASTPKQIYLLVLSLSKKYFSGPQETFLSAIFITIG